MAPSQRGFCNAQEADLFEPGNRTRWTSKERMRLATVAALLLLFPPTIRARASDPVPAPDPPEPMAGQATDMALTSFPVCPRTGFGISLAAGLLGATTRGHAEYREHQALATTLTGWYGRTLPWTYLRQFAVGLEIRGTSWLVEEVDVPPAISERDQRLGLGTIRVALSAQILDSSIWKHPRFWRLALSVWMRTSLPTTTLVLNHARYPKVPWLEALGPAARDSKAALLELAGVTGLVSFWRDRASVRLSWAPLIWGVASGTKDRFFTRLQLDLGGRPWWRARDGWALRGLELLGEIGLLAAYNEPVYTEHMNAGTFGLGVRLWLGPLGLEAGFRYGLGSTTISQGEMVGELSATYKFDTKQERTP